MGGNANKIVIAVVAVLALAMVFLFVGSGSCSGGGGGGAAPSSAPAASTASEASAMSGYGDMTVDELRALLDGDVAPVGDNARSAATSSGVSTAAETYGALRERGFSDVEVSADFDINGVYTGMKVVDAASGDKYPSYMAYYPSEKDVVWIIYVNDGNFIASPLGGESGALSKRLVFAESDSVTQYDGDRNEYSEFALDSLSGMKGVKVGRVDKATLDSYALSDLEKM